MTTAPHSAAEDIAGRIYREMGLAAPRVIQYPSLQDAILDFSSWKRQAKRLSPVLWNYQYPILHPHGYWAQYHLFQDEFQFDINRTTNKHGCYSHGRPVSRIPAAASILYRYYLDAAINACRHDAPTVADLAFDQVRHTAQAFLEELDGVLWRHEPTCQCGADEFVFLGAQSWVRVEFEMLEAMRSCLRQSVCEEHYQNTRSLHEHGGLFLTFEKLVVAAPGPA